MVVWGPWSTRGWGPMGHWSIDPANFSKNVNLSIFTKRAELPSFSSSSNSKLAMSLYTDNDYDNES